MGLQQLRPEMHCLLLVILQGHNLQDFSKLPRYYWTQVLQYPTKRSMQDEVCTAEHAHQHSHRRRPGAGGCTLPQRHPVRVARPLQAAEPAPAAAAALPPSPRSSAAPGGLGTPAAPVAEQEEHGAASDLSQETSSQRVTGDSPGLWEGTADPCTDPHHPPAVNFGTAKLAERRLHYGPALTACTRPSKPRFSTRACWSCRVPPCGRLPLVGPRAAPLFGCTML